MFNITCTFYKSKLQVCSFLSVTAGHFIWNMDRMRNINLLYDLLFSGVGFLISSLQVCFCHHHFTIQLNRNIYNAPSLNQLCTWNTSILLLTRDGCAICQHWTEIFSRSTRHCEYRPLANLRTRIRSNTATNTSQQLQKLPLWDMV